MVSQGLDQSRWLRSEPRRILPAPIAERIIRAAFPGCSVIEIQPFASGFRNANFRLCLDLRSDWIVLRLFEHDASLCQKELDLINLIGTRVPVPEVIYAEPRGSEDCPPFILMRYIEGISLHELKRGADHEAIRQAAHSAGKTLAAINQITFSSPGWLAPGPTVTTQLLEGSDPMPRFIDLCLASSHLQLRMGADLCGRVHALVWSWAAQLADLSGEARLVHGDFNRRNLLVRSIAGLWSVAAVLDWEFALSGSPLNDIGNFLRYERASQPLLEPHFSTGYLRAGGALPDEWRRLARLVDLTALCESLTRDQLPAPVISELVELVRITVEDRPD